MTNPRGLASGFVTEITKNGFAPIVLIGAHFTSGDLNLWTGVGNLTYNGSVYTGAVPILGIDKVDEQKTTAASSVVISLSGLDTTMATLADNEPYQERYLDMTLALLDSSGAIISTPYQFFKGFMDFIKILDDGTSVTIALTVENMLVRLERARASTYTPADQNIEFPNDTGFNFVTDIQNRAVTWG